MPRRLDGCGVGLPPSCGLCRHPDLGANSASVGHGALVLADAFDMLVCADLAAALTLEAYHGNVAPLAEEVHTIRPYSGQLASAERMRMLLVDSSLWDGASRRRIQDPLSLRCTTQVHGACLDALFFVRGTVETELNSTGDNPVVLADRRAIVSNGNFHPAALAMALTPSRSRASPRPRAWLRIRVLKLMDPELSGFRPNSRRNRASIRDSGFCITMSPLRQCQVLLSGGARIA